ncbi:hypothetical protein [Luteolibacter marinus]|uniref:hypothetical protein n=1 Tax=Luteolibacter marinus TaxID=2776705 RepID=UPI001868A4A6|nr:hypothetical protein [Luteolibacter marinus]
MNPAESSRHPAWKFWTNPIFRRYCRSRLRPRGLGIWVLITVLFAGFIVSMASSIGVRTHLDAEDAARGAILPLLVLQGIVLFILGTAQVAGGMTAERDEGVIDYQRLIPMTPLAKVVGYLFGLPVREYVMFLTTLPFTAWAMWRGGISWQVWLPLYGIVFTSTLTYHFTGLLTGTVVKNRRWAFLTSIGLVFALYTVVPQMAKFGLVFFKYLSVTPVVQESMPKLLPKTAGAALETLQQLVPTVKFFGLDFSEAVFTAFCQGGLVLVFSIMLCRKWRRHESHLLGKLWAIGFFVWIQLLLLGNALPLIDSGSLFPSRAFNRMMRIIPDWQPDPGEAVAMSGIFGLVTLLLIFLLATIITPSSDHQIRGWRRARKEGAKALPLLSDAATGYWAVVLMALAGAGGWFWFTSGLVESRWFPGHEVPSHLFVAFAAVLLAAGLGFQAMLEAKGGRFVGLMVILVGVVPIMVGAVFGSLSNSMAAVAAWLIGMSPVSLPVYASMSLLSLSDLPVEVARAVPRAFKFWLFVAVIAAVHRSYLLWQARRDMARTVLADPVE